MERHAIEGEKIFTNHVSDKGLVPKIHKNPILKIGKRFEQTLHQRKSTDTKKHVKGCSTSSY